MIPAAALTVAVIAAAGIAAYLLRPQHAAHPVQTPLPFTGLFADSSLAADRAGSLFAVARAQNPDPEVDGVLFDGQYRYSPVIGNWRMAESVAAQSDSEQMVSNDLVHDVLDTGRALTDIRYEISISETVCATAIFTVAAD